MIDHDLTESVMNDIARAAARTETAADSKVGEPVRELTPDPCLDPAVAAGTAEPESTPVGLSSAAIEFLRSVLRG
jgi:hypothetical protein